MAKGDSEKTAAELLQESRTIPGQATDPLIPTLFSPEPYQDRFIEKGNKPKDADRPGLQVNLECQTRTFVLWRPYESCSRCQAVLNSGALSLPDDGDITCPHTQEQEYREVVNDILQGNAVKQFEEFFMLKNGVRGVQLVWLIPDKASLKKMDEAKEKDKVWPPNPEKVFSVPVEEPKKTEGSNDEPPS